MCQDHSRKPSQDIKRAGEKSAGSDLSEISWEPIKRKKEEQLLKEIDDDMLWFDLTYLLNEPQERAAPEIHITIDYTVRAFEETEKKYLELYSFFTHWKK